MSTISERVAAAFKAVTGEDKALSGSWHAATSTHSLEVRNILGHAPPRSDRTGVS